MRIAHLSDPHVMRGPLAAQPAANLADAIGIPFLDGMILTDAAELAGVIQRYPHVARVLAGHAHRDVSALFGGTLMTVAPSTYRQSALRLHDAQPPGYVADPTSFLLHVLDGANSARSKACATSSACTWCRTPSP